MDREDILQLQQIIEEMNREGVPVVVEGKRDAAALRSLGFAGEIVRFHGCGGFGRFAERVSGYGRIVLLLDYDRAGRRMTRRLVRILRGGTRVDLAYRRKIHRSTCGQIKFIEQLKVAGSLVDGQPDGVVYVMPNQEYPPPAVPPPHIMRN